MNNIPVDPETHTNQVLDESNEYVRNLVELGYTKEKLDRIQQLDFLIINGLFKEL